MSDEDKLFQQNPLMAIWIKLKKIEEVVSGNREIVKKNHELLDDALDDLDAEDQKGEEDGLDD